MDCGETEESAPPAVENNVDTQDVNETESAENFQKFVYELFEKNGILNDLRAYLRGHIVNVLNSAQTGDPPACQKHFTQRLDLTFQALNILIAEYLLHLEFSYTLSVFVSEIPLANMVFDFAKRLLLKTNESYTGMKFKENDVWSVLNYLGLKCDSDHVSKILDMYKNEEHMPLLLCILKCMPMYRKEPICTEQMNTSTESLSSSVKSCDSEKNSRNFQKHKCKHVMFCKACQGRIVRLKEKYKRKKQCLARKIKETDLNPLNVETLMRNVSVMERSLIDEMFQQLKTVYEAEVDMVKVEEERKVKRSLATHAALLQKRREEMEQAFKDREEELENNVQQKKKFLWGLARTLREQHAQMSRAMHAVRNETERLSAKEESFKTQLMEADEILRKRGEEMRAQISNELVILEGHLESMKKERENINRERSELQHLKTICDSSSKAYDIEPHETSDDLRSHYDLLGNELTLLKKYLETTKLQPKCVLDRSTMTDLNGVTSEFNVMLNNEQDAERSYTKEDERGTKTPNLLINDLKKQKNVNFSQLNLAEMYRDGSRDLSHSSASGEASDAAARSNHELLRARARDSLQRLHEENERLKSIARQQNDLIEELSSHQGRLQSELTAARVSAEPGRRPRTAPAVMPHPELFNGQSVNPNVNTSGWRKGAGEELNLFSSVQPRIVVPGDTLPFIGVLRDRHADTRRHMINQWRALRRRMSPLGGACKMRAATHAQKEIIFRPSPKPSGSNTAAATSDMNQRSHQNSVFHFTRIPDEIVGFMNVTSDRFADRPPTAVTLESKNRDKSPNSVLREAKQNLRNKDSIKDNRPMVSREKSPNSVLREAKLRLRKLEIEAEAVEKSYLNFRMRQSELKGNWKSCSPANEEAVVTKDIGVIDIKMKKSQSLHKLNQTYRVENIDKLTSKDARHSRNNDFEKYLLDYQTKYDIGSARFKNKNTVAIITKPIPKAYSEVEKDKNSNERPIDNFIDKPLIEFRKLYDSQKLSTPVKREILSAVTGPNAETVDSVDTETELKELKAKKDALIKAKNSKLNEIKILKNNINKMYNLQEQLRTESHEKSSIDETENKDDGMVPNITEKIEDDQNLLRVELECVNDVNNIIVTDTERQEVLLVVQGTVDEREIHQSDSDIEGEKISPNMTILISPKRSVPKAGNNVEIDGLNSPEKSRRSVSPEQAAHLTRNDVLDAIFHANLVKEASSLNMQPDISKQDSITEVEKYNEEYADDFSADVDNYNYNSHSEDDHRSPISLLKTNSTGDETFSES